VTKNRELVDQLSGDFRTAKALRPQDRVMLDYAAKLAREPWAMSQDDVIKLRDAGFSDRAILEINLAGAYMLFVNRVAEGLCVELEGHLGAFTR
jgi:alkylhydroperoxidase family enzyme